MSPQLNKLPHFWQELKRRRVIHVITLYASAAFVIIELVGNLTEPLNLPSSLTTIVIIVLAVGFPLAVILSWLYDLTSRGVERTRPLEEIEEDEVKQVPNAWRIATYVSFVVIIGLVTINIVGGSKQLRAGEIQSLLILPFENFTGDDQLDYVAAGMHTFLIGDMGQISGLRVISKTTARMYENMNLSLPDMASELNADAVLEPTFMCYGDSVCIQIRVVTPFPEEKQLWIGEYKEEKSQIMNLYNRVTKQIADEVKVQLTAEEEHILAESRTINIDAYDAYIRGLYYWDQFTPEALQLALEYFSKAIESDPEWAEPYAGVAYFWVAARQFGMAPASVTIPNIYQNLNKAIELDPGSSFVHYVNALTALATEFNWGKTEEELLGVLKVNPNYAFAHVYYAHLLTILKRMDEAVVHNQIGLELDPLNPMIQGLSILVLAETGQYEEAIAMAEKILNIVPGHPLAIANLSTIYAIIGEYRKSIEYWTIGFQFSDDIRNSILNTYDNQGVVPAINEFINIIEESRGDSFPMDLAQLYSFAGNTTMALHWYKRAYEERDPMLIYFNTLYACRGPFRIDDPGFDSILIELDLPVPMD